MCKDKLLIPVVDYTFTDAETGQVLKRALCLMIVLIKNAQSAI